MEFTVRTLIVEDDKNEQQSWNDAIELHNVESDKHGFRIEHKIAASLEEASNDIFLRDFDAAIVDIRLQQADGTAAPNTDGNQVLELILNSEMAVVAAFTGEAVLASPPNGFSKVVNTFTKGEGTDAVMRWLFSQVAMIRHIRAARFAIQNEMAHIFSKSIWPRWKNWMDDSTSEQADSGEAVIRHITSYIYATLLEKGQHQVHPEEWYFVPPVRDGLRTGDLIKQDTGIIEVVVTPRCDLANNNKNETIQLAECLDVSGEWNKRTKKISEAEKALKDCVDDKKRPDLEGKLKSAKEELRNFTQHRNTNVYHFLPWLRIDKDTMGPFMVRFDKVRSIPRTDTDTLNALAERRVAAITTEFLPSLVERLGTFFSRIGTPDYYHISGQ